MPAPRSAPRQAQDQTQRQTAIQPFDPGERAKALSRLLDERREQLASYLSVQPDNAMVDRFRQVAFDAVVKDRNLLEADPMSLLASIYHAAQMGLEPSSVMGEGAIVVYRDQEGGRKVAQFQPMVRGLAKLARNSGQVTAIGVDIRHAKDHFVYRSGTDPVVEHEPWIEDEDPGDVLGAYAYAKLSSGELVVLYMSVPELLKRRNVSKSWRNSGDQSIWGAWPEEMMKKTVLRRLLVEKVPLSYRLASAIAADDVVEGHAIPAEVRPALAAASPRRSRLASRLVGDPLEEGGNGDGASDGDTSASAPAGAQPAENAPAAASDSATPASEPVRAICGAQGLSEDARCQREPHPAAESHLDQFGRSWLGAQR